MSASERPDDLLEELAAACRQVAVEGHEDGAWGHLSVRDPAGRGLWLKASGRGLGEITGPDDFVLLDLDGHQLAGDGGRHLEWPIHAEILRRRPDVDAVAHTHAMALRLFASTDEPLRQLMTDATLFAAAGLPRFTLTSQLITTPELGAALADALGDARAVLLAQHGGAIVGGSIAELAVTTICLGRAIAGQMTLAATGWRCVEAPAQEAAEKAEVVYSDAFWPQHWGWYLRRDGRTR